MAELCVNHVSVKLFKVPHSFLKKVDSWCQNWEGSQMPSVLTTPLPFCRSGN